MDVVVVVHRSDASDSRTPLAVALITLENAASSCSIQLIWFATKSERVCRSVGFCVTAKAKQKKKNGRVLFCCCCFFWLLCYSRTSCSGLLLLRRLRYSWSRSGFLIDGVVIWLAGLTPLIRRRRHPRRSQSKRLSAVPRRCNPRRGSKASILENSTETISFLFFLLKTIQKAGRFS